MQNDTFISQVRTQLRAAFKSYNIQYEPDSILISTDLRGNRTLGLAGSKYLSDIKSRLYYMKFNSEALSVNPDYILKTTVPHEIAHIICFLRPELGKNHNYGWKSVCASIGGTPNRVSTEFNRSDLTPLRKTQYFKYNVNGQIIEVGPKHHKKIQNGSTTILLKKGKQPVLAHMLMKGDTIVSKPTAIPNPTNSVPAAGTKVAQATVIFKNNVHKPAGQIIELFQTQLNMSKAGAQTYYYNIKKAMNQ